MARVSPAQLEVLRRVIETTPQPSSGRQFRIAILHHHLRAPSLREELKLFPDISNLEHLRSFLRDRGVALVIHGHKHEHAAQFEHIYNQEGDRDHRALVISGATFEPGHELDAARLITLRGLPNSPSVTIEPVPVPRGGVDPANPASKTYRIWSAEEVPGAPFLVQGSDLNEVYDRVCEVAENDAAGGTLIVHLDIPAGENGILPLPANYPLPEPMEADERRRWLNELVEWWQLERSGLEHRMPFAHGTRLRRFGGKINQIERIKRLLRAKPSTRALAVLIDPFRDFTTDGAGEEFASFCLVEFKRRSLDGGRAAVDAIAFYRAQEFARWWPINIAELRFLQKEICDSLQFIPGRITTIAADARTYSRSPMQVAMPILDRWLDQAPERLHSLANALAHGKIEYTTQHDAVRGWERALDDLEQTTKEYNPDGLPIAIEGLNLLASYLEVIEDKNDTFLGDFIRILRRLARENEGFEKSNRTKEDFDRWAASAFDEVTELRRLTMARFEKS